MLNDLRLRVLPLGALRILALRLITSRSAIQRAALAAAVPAFIVYVLTLLPGVSVGDWAEMQKAPSALDIAHPTGYPTYVLLGKLWSFLPIGSVAFRMNLLSAVYAAVAVGLTVLILGRLGVRPTLAWAGALLLAFTGTLWGQATVADENTLQLALVALLLWLALRWRDERRPADLRLAALVAGLVLGNHLLSLGVVPFVAVYMLWVARSELRQRWREAVQAIGIGLAALLVYAYIPLRALVGPPQLYGWLLNWSGFWHLVSGEVFRGAMTFGSAESIALVAKQVPVVADLIGTRVHAVLLPLALVGILAAPFLLKRNWAATAALFLAVFAADVYLYAAYRGSREYYLLTGFLILAICFSLAIEGLARLVERVDRDAPLVVALPSIALALLVGAGNWGAHDLSHDHSGEEMVAEIFGYLPRNAVLITYWDTMTSLDYAHCIEGERPDLTIQSLDPTETNACTLRLDPGAAMAAGRPVFALFVIDAQMGSLRARFTLRPVADVLVPFGLRQRQYSRPLYVLAPGPGG
jgi:Protein of unknown function (DUF2723)